jgi:diamine N-acetyltransferase
LEAGVPVHIILRDVTRDNWRDVARLKVREDQQNFVATNVYSLAESKYEPTMVPLAVFDGGTLVGFTMWGIDPETSRYWVIRVMIDERYQGRGYGRALMEALISRLLVFPDCHELYVSFEPENHVAEALYESLGFRKTGEILEGEAVSRLHMDAVRAARNAQDAA